MLKFFKTCLLIIFLLCCIAYIGIDNIAFKKYNGENLNIAIIGKIPSIREENITFSEINFIDLEDESALNQYDAIFITKENLMEASKEKYSSIYKEYSIPFFFIKNPKGATPFIHGELSYENMPQISDPPSYASGILKNIDGPTCTEYWLYNDIESSKTIKYLYSEIFKAILDNKQDLKELIKL